MVTLHCVFGPQGAGKSTYSKQLARSESANLFSIDDWMNELYGADMPKPLNFAWVMERVKRCESRIWQTAKDIANTGGKSILDLGFMKAQHRLEYSQRAKDAGLSTQWHYVTAPLEVRRNRVMARNQSKGETFSFEVTPQMFDFMESQFEAPTATELSLVTICDTQ
ncbi:MAG: AAA family ATPase [Trueperaceae bacterium]